MLGAVGWLMADGLADGDFVWWNFFNFFTIQTNLIGVATLAIAARFTGRERPAWVEWLRLSATTYLVIVAIVYWVLLFPEAGPPDNPIADYTLHAVSAVAIAADWLVEGPRRRLAFTRVWVVLLYPAAWIAMALIRGATDGWVPYFFLDPANGYASIVVTIVMILLAGLVLAAVLFLATRWRALGPDAGTNISR